MDWRARNVSYLSSDLQKLLFKPEINTAIECTQKEVRIPAVAVMFELKIMQGCQVVDLSVQSLPDRELRTWLSSVFERSQLKRTSSNNPKQRTPKSSETKGFHCRIV